MRYGHFERFVYIRSENALVLGLVWVGGEKMVPLDARWRAVMEVAA
jgi:hypothetical protein